MSGLGIVGGRFMAKSRKAKSILVLKGLCKSFDDKPVLKGVDFEVNKGEIHAIYGEKDSGKTTLIKIIAGLLKQDGGTIFLNDAKITINSPKDAKDAGLEFVHQKLSIFPDLSILDNIFLGHEYPLTRFGSISTERMMEQVDRIPAPFKLDIDYRTAARDLTTLQMWKIMLNRAIVVKSKVLFVDELSSSFGFDELKQLFHYFNQLKNEGASVVYVTDKMSEIFEIADRLTILKDGQSVGRADVRDTDNWALFRMMVGPEDLEGKPPKTVNSGLKSEKKAVDEISDINETLAGLEFDGIVGESFALKKVLAQVVQVADTDASVLITGETGVGKELIARAIHMHSRRLDKAFISVHCSALSETLLTSELFGHEKGSFTGANERRIGRFELADGGTLFLDEIGEFTTDIQVRLLRVIQTKEFQRVGGNQTLRSDFRLIAATNRNLEDEVSSGRFRQDLFYRLNVVPINVPPLRQRIEDIPALAHYFVSLHATKIGRRVQAVADEDIERLKYYHWPGNIRELENIIERATILSRGKRWKYLIFSRKTPDQPPGRRR